MIMTLVHLRDFMINKLWRRERQECMCSLSGEALIVVLFVGWWLEEHGFLTIMKPL